MDTLIFIDTNIFLDFYRFRSEAGLGMLKHIDSNHDRIITSAQVEMEYKKNRQRVILESYRQLRIPDFSALQAPAFLAQAKPTRAIERHRDGITARVKTLKSRLEGVLRAPSRHDPVYKTAQRLFRDNGTLNLSRDKEIKLEIRELAQKRFALGYPPRKPADTSYGDAINWEWLLRCAKDGTKHLVIVTRDSDYGLAFDGKPILNDWLLQEFRERVARKRRLILTDRLTEAFKAAAVRVSKQEEQEEEKLVSEVRNGGAHNLTPSYVESQIICSCGAVLLVHWEARLGVVIGENSVECPACKARYRIPAPVVRLFRRENDRWIEATVRAGSGPAEGFEKLLPSPPVKPGT
jgi:predicted nucleic acid-binding protein